MLPWLQRRWRTGELRSIDGGEQMCFKSRFKYRERVTVLNRDRERVPDRWCCSAERAFAEGSSSEWDMQQWRMGSTQPKQFPSDQPNTE